jgi:predicted NAD-dependent protein-ADP-ribosyltransferase YbiA (DUF1768 family)
MAVTPADARTVDQLLSVIRDGGQPKYLLFWGHQPPPAGGVGKGCLSQWWPAAFTVDGVSYPSAEHYMMAAKARLSGDAETVGKILAAPHPGAAKALARHRTPNDPVLRTSRATPQPTSRRAARRIRYAGGSDFG